MTPTAEISSSAAPDAANSSAQAVDPMFIDALQDLLAKHCTPAVVRAVEGGEAQAAQILWRSIQDAGFADAMLPEAKGGAGLSLGQCFPLFELCGRYVLPLPLAETMVARAWALQHQVPCPAEPVSLAWMDASVASFAGQNKSTAPLDTHLMRAALTAAHIAGALQRVLDMSLQYANERQQFGKPLGKFQAIQHQLAVMAEQVFAARMAAQIGCSSMAQGNSAGDAATWQPDPLRAAIAKARTSEAAVEVAALAHSIHGAIGFTEAFDLQLYTRRLHLWRQTASSESFWHQRLGESMMKSPDSTLDLLRACTDVV